MNGDTVRNKDWAGDENMTKANRQFSMVATFGGAGLPEVGATLLILLGIIFQLGELGYGHLGLGNNLWFFSIMLTDIWNILSMRLNIPAVADLLRYWPLILVGLGLAILLATHENRSSRARRGIRHDE
jgi:hypothetical protein